MTITEKKLTLFIIIEGVSKQRCSNEMRLRGNKQKRSKSDQTCFFHFQTVTFLLTLHCVLGQFGAICHTRKPNTLRQAEPKPQCRYTSFHFRPTIIDKTQLSGFQTTRHRQDKKSIISRQISRFQKQTA